MLSRRLFLRQAAVASAAITAGSIGEGAALPALSAGSLAAIAAWQTAQRTTNDIWDRYCAAWHGPEQQAVYREWQNAYAVTQNALTAMLGTLHTESIGGGI